MADEQRTKAGLIIETGKVAGAFTTVCGAAVLIYGMTIGPLGEIYTEIRSGMETNRKIQSEQQVIQAGQRDILSSITNVIAMQSQNVARIERLEAQRAENNSPVIRFTTRGHSVENGPPGGTVEIAWQFFKLRDCGQPAVDLMFRNGGGRLHRFENVSILDAAGRGVSSAPDPIMAQIIKYTARIPAEDGVLPGQGSAWVRVAYPDCPTVRPEVSPEAQFTILPN